MGVLLQNLIHFGCAKSDSLGSYARHRQGEIAFKCKAQIDVLLLAFVSRMGPEVEISQPAVAGAAAVEVIGGGVEDVYIIYIVIAAGASCVRSGGVFFEPWERFSTNCPSEIPK